MKRFIEIELLGMHFFGVNSINAQRRENSDKIATTFGFCSLSFKSFRCQNQSVILVFFNAGQCGKDEICKFSHDPSVEHIVEKKYLMLMKQWIKLDWKEIEKKSSKRNRKEKNKCQLLTLYINWSVFFLFSIRLLQICKYFLDAVLQKSQYGWFWINS